jgi:EpsI family protein
MTKLIVAVTFLTLNFYTYYYLASEPVIPPRQSFAEFPLELDGWHCDASVRMEEQIRLGLGVTDYLLCDFRRNRGEVVNTYFGYHQTQVRDQGGGGGLAANAIHPPAHCLPGSGWDIIDNRTVKLDLPGLPEPDARGRRLIIAKGNARQLVYYWYQSRGRVIAEDWKKIIYVGWDRATRGRTDGSLVRFTVGIVRNDEETAEAALRSLASQVLPRLSRYVPE